MKRPAWWPTPLSTSPFLSLGYSVVKGASAKFTPSAGRSSLLVEPGGLAQTGGRLPEPPNFRLPPLCGSSGGAGGTRTPDFRLAKAALSQLSYGPTGFTAWWAMVDSNHRPRSYQDRALTG